MAASVLLVVPHITMAVASVVSQVILQAAFVSCYKRRRVGVYSVGLEGCEVFVDCVF